MNSKHPKVLGPYRPVVRFGDLLFVSGQTGLDPATGEMADATVEGQTRQTMENLKAVLESEGLGCNHVLKTTVFLARIQDFAAVNLIYSDYFQGNFPARSTVAVAGLPKGALVEIEAVAAKKQ